VSDITQAFHFSARGGPIDVFLGILSFASLLAHAHDLVNIPIIPFIRSVGSVLVNIPIIPFLIGR